MYANSARTKHIISGANVSIPAFMTSRLKKIIKNTKQRNISNDECQKYLLLTI